MNAHPYDEKTVARFWSKVNKNGPVPAHCPELGPCWVWTGGVSGEGDFKYGRFVTCLNRISKHYPSHRFAYLLEYHVAPPVVMHKCDNPKCVRWAHLAGGTQADNVRDCAKKKRNKGGNGRTGEAVNTAKFTAFGVRTIRKEHSENHISYLALAKKYGVRHSSIQRIVERKSWKHIP